MFYTPNLVLVDDLTSIFIKSERNMNFTKFFNELILFSLLKHAEYESGATGSKELSSYHAF